MRRTTSPQPRPLRPTRHYRKWLLVPVVLAAVAGLAYLGWYLGFRQVVPHYADAEEHYKYGSIGNETIEGIPYWIWIVLPRVFPQYLPGNGGYAALGMVWEAPRTTAAG